jgi:valyl-tRNA synthetase
MDKAYDHKLVEDKIYQKWEASGAFKPNSDPKAKPYTIIMPPPNANDPLHIGHAMFITVEDILIRYHRMRGEATLWLPGADHAGIETQFVFEKKLKKQDKSRFDFDRETLFKMIWDYVQENAGVAKNQMKKIGASADWSRFTFTLDEKIVDIVLNTFDQLHKEGLIYRDLRLVNYCTRCGTGYSELEAKHDERKDPLLYIKYGSFTIATVRPETKFRDTALAVNPADQRYKKHIGKTFEISGLLGPISMKVIADDEVDPKFGTGIMKVTPAHDFHDFELGQKYHLPVTPIIDFNGKMGFSWFINDPKFASQPAKYQERAKTYHGLHVSKARPLMIEHLKQDGLIEKIDENYTHNVATCYRCGTVLEPLPLPQFFLKVAPLTKKVLTALKKKETVIYGPGYDKILTHWLKNLKDWNISRQIVWGIRIPVWYSSKETNSTITFLTKEKQLKTGELKELLKTYSLEEIKNGLQSLKAPVDAKFVLSKTSPGPEYLQETDTFDTWFSSAQWPFATLKANSPGDLARFYPTQVMETAYDILIFWVMRMLMMGIHITGKVPFEKVYLHGLVRDDKGQKMSKSKGNVINPLDIVDKYGADALRFALVMSTTAGKDSNTGDAKIRGMRNFTNKLWNAARFIILNKDNGPYLTADKKMKTPYLASVSEPKKVDHEYVSKQQYFGHIHGTTRVVTKQLKDLKIGLAAETIYNDFWHWYCDEAIELCKRGYISVEDITTGLETFLILLHPFMPFITEEIWGLLGKKEMLITTKWPLQL